MSRMLYQLSYAAVIKPSIAYFALFCQGHQKLYFKENNRYRKKQAALPAAALPFARGTSRFALVASAAADRDWNRTARTFLPKSSLAIGQSGSAAVPLPRVSPFYLYACFLCIHFRYTCPAYVKFSKIARFARFARFCARTARFLQF